MAESEAIASTSTSEATATNEPISVPPNRVKLTSDQYTHVIALIHGIKDIAAWQHTVSDVLQRTGVHVAQLRYGYVPALRFMFPLNLSAGPVAKIVQQLQDLKAQYKNAKLCVIAHSFGTYVVLEALRKDHNLEIWKLVLCGSVADDETNWSDIRHRIGDRDRPTKDFIVNDCGTADSWPLLATGFSWHYGMAGVTGFSEVHVTNRFHKASDGSPGGHSLYFNRQFVERSWRPFLIEDHEPSPGNGVQGQDLPKMVRLFYNPIFRFVGRSLLLSVWLAIAAVLVSSVVWIGYSAKNYISTWGNGHSVVELAIDMPLPPELLPSPNLQNESSFPTSDSIRNSRNAHDIESVMFQYRNDSTRNLKLLLFDCQSILQAPENLRVLEWPLGANNNSANQAFNLYSGFRKGSNWYGIYIFDLASREPTLVGYRDLTNYAEWKLTIVDRNDALHGVLTGE